MKTMKERINTMIRILSGDCRKTLLELEDASVQCCITSPPYWGLRDYGTADWEGGEGDCDHLSDRTNYEKGFEGSKQATNKGTGNRDIIRHNVCPKCGAKRVDSQLGLEPTPEEYVENMVEVFRQVRRVLKDDGTLWLNLGDTYAGGASAGNKAFGNPEFNENRPSRQATKTPQKTKPPNLKAKDIVGIPWRVAFALQADGWYLRQDIIWSKPNPMPESVTDRCTKAHEYLFLLAKQSKYYYDNQAVSEPAVYAGDDRGSRTDNRRDEPMCNSMSGVTGDTRNKRSVWTVTTKPYKDAHFAVFPTELITPCVLAGTKAGDVILDPFGGSGTTGKVAIENGRRAILCELNPEYAELIEKRTTTTMGFGF